MRIGIVDADLLGREKHRFPNLVCEKLSGYWKEKGAEVRLILDASYNWISYQSTGKLCLASVIDNFEIYALSWDDIFISFENRYKFMLEKIQKDFEESAEEDGEEVNRDYVTKKVEALIAMTAN